VPYIGKQLVRGQNRKLDDISSGFNGSQPTFTLQVASQNVTVGSALQLWISVGGVIQNPLTDFTVAGNQITFTTPPAASLDFFGVIQGDVTDTNTPGDATVTSSKLATGLTVNLADGSAATSSLQLGGTDSGLFSSAADKVNVTTGGVERLEIGDSEVVFNDPSNDVDFRVESNGNTHMLFVDAGNDRVGIGTSSPSSKLHVLNPSGGSGTTEVSTIERDNSGYFFKLYRNAGSGNVGGLLGADSAGTYFTGGHNTNNKLYIDAANGLMQFFTNSSERMRIDSSGRLLVGTSSSRSVSSLSSSLQVEGTGGDSSTISVTRNVASAAPPRVCLAKSRGTSVGSSIVVQSGDSLGEISFSGADGTDANSVAATILCQVDGTPGSNDMPGRLMFSTTADGASSSTERMRIDSSGNVGIGATSAAQVLQVHKAASSASYVHITNSVSGSTSSDGMLVGLNASAAALVWNQENTEMRFATNNTERMRIDSSGRLLYGHSTSRTIYGIQSPVQIEGTNFETGSLAITCNNVSDFPILLLARSRGSSTGSNTAPTDGQVIGEVSFVPSDGTNMGAASVRLQGVADDNHAENDVPGRFVIQVVPDGSESSAEKFRLHNGGKLSVVGVYNGTTTGGSPVYVEADGDLLRYTSSLKYKTDVETIEDARADAILNCRPVWYRSKCDNDIKTEGSEKSDWGWYGFIAEEVAEIEPRLVNWATKDAVTQENGLNKTVERDPADYSAEGVRYDNFVPLLVNLVKRQQAAIETLEAKVAALEAE
jgi:hypothetical protein